jgi:hypothetical protein
MVISSILIKLDDQINVNIENFVLDVNITTEYEENDHCVDLKSSKMAHFDENH